MYQTYHHEKYLWMILIHWLKFLFLIFSFLPTNYIFLTIFFFKFTIPYFVFTIFIVTPQVLRIFSPRHLSVSFPLPLLFPFIFFFLISHFSFFLSLFSSLFSFFQFASFPQFGLPFPESAAPVLPHSLLPCRDLKSALSIWYIKSLSKINLITLFWAHCNLWAWLTKMPPYQAEIEQSKRHNTRADQIIFSDFWSK